MIWKRVVYGSSAAIVLAAALFTAWNCSATGKVEGAIARLRAAGLPASPAELNLPPVPDESNAAHLYRAAFALIEAVPGSIVNALPAPRVTDEVRQAIPALAEVYELVYRAARLPDCNFSLRYEDGYSMLLPHLVPFRRIGSLLASRAAVRAESGDVDGALDDLRALFQMTRALGTEPILVSQLVRIAVAQTGLLALAEVLPRADSAAAAVERVSPDSCRGAIARGLRGECAVALSLLDGRVLERVLLDGSTEVALSLKIPLLRGPVLKSDLAFLAGIFEEEQRALKSPYPEALALTEAIRRRAEREGGPVTRLLVPNVMSCIRREVALAAHAELARLAARFLDHRRTRGSYPEGLDRLADGPAPQDPFTGKPFLLQRQDGALVLASEGDPEVRLRLP